MEVALPILVAHLSSRSPVILSHSKTIRLLRQLYVSLTPLMLFNISSMIQKQTSYSSSYKNLVSLFSPIIFLQISRMTYEEKFKKLVREMHQYIKAYHHLTNVHISDGTTQEPLGMVRTMRRLESVIKPAVPTVTTNLMLYGNARNWLH